MIVWNLSNRNDLAFEVIASKIASKIIISNL